MKIWCDVKTIVLFGKSCKKKWFICENGSFFQLLFKDKAFFLTLQNYIETEDDSENKN